MSDHEELNLGMNGRIHLAMTLVAIILALALFWTAQASANNALVLEGISYSAPPLQQGKDIAQDLESLRSVAAKCKGLGMHHINLVGPLLFDGSSLDPKLETLIQDLHKIGFTVSYSINAFFNKEKGDPCFAWRDQKGRTVEEGYLCMVASRKTRVPQIKECITKGISAGFDAVLFDHFDWGTNQDNVCFCDACIREFNSFTGKNLTRDTLVEKLFVNDQLIPVWWEWRMKVRTEIASELVKYARDVAEKQNRMFQVGQFLSGRGSEPEYSGSLFDIHVTTIPEYAQTADQVSRVFQSLKKRSPSTAKIVALISGTLPPEQLTACLQGAILGGADGWLLQIPAERPQDYLNTALEAIRSVKKQPE